MYGVELNMGRGSGAYKFLGIVFIFFLLIQGICVAEEVNKASMSSNNTVNGTNSNTENNLHVLSSILLLPLFLGSFLFLCWACRFFEEMTFCFVLFMLLLLFFLIDFMKLTSYRIGWLLDALIACPIIYLIYIETKDILKMRGTDQKVKNILKKMRSINIIGTVLMWPVILIYYYTNDIRYITFFGIKELEFPIYIITASFIGVLSYLFLSVEETFRHLIPEYEKLSIVWSYIKRIFTAPFIAIIGYYLLNHFQIVEKGGELNNYFVFVFSFFAGVFTKTIEEWIYSWAQKLLPENKRDEFYSRIEYDVNESEFVKKLKFDSDVAYMLYNAKIRTIEELAVLDPMKLINKLNRDMRDIEDGESTGSEVSDNSSRRKIKDVLSMLKQVSYWFRKNQPESLSNNPESQANKPDSQAGQAISSDNKNTPGIDSYSLEQAKMYVKRAKDYLNMDTSIFVTKLKMDKDLAYKLYYFTKIETINDLINSDPKELHKKICDCKKGAEELARREKIDIEKAHETLCECSEEKIKRFIEKAKEELEREELGKKELGQMELQKRELQKRKLEKKRLEKNGLETKETKKEEIIKRGISKGETKRGEIIKIEFHKGGINKGKIIKGRVNKGGIIKKGISKGRIEAKK